MSHPIKFRAWGFGRMHTEPEIVYNDTDSINMVFDQDGLTFMQYTGLKDKNGVEIYEGDIIKKKGTGWGFRVGFAEGSFILEHVGHCNANLSSWRPQDLEVIGNVYENPEHLEVAA